VNLITNVKTAANNKDDGEILNGQITAAKEITPKLKELYTDAAYGNEKNDLLMDKLDISHVQTAIKGQERDRTLEIERGAGRNTFYVSCPHQCVKTYSDKGKLEASLDPEKCMNCTNSKCAMAVGKSKNCVYVFDKADYLRQKRIKSIEKIPDERKHLRNNVEATCHEYRTMETDKKLKVRGDFKTAIFAILGAVAINFGRIYRKMIKTGGKFPNYIKVYFNFVQNLAEFIFNKLFQSASVKICA